MSATRSFVWAVFCIGAAVSFGGCGSKFNLGEVTGIVTMDGTPTGGLQILFEPLDKDQPSSLGFTQSDGRYELRCSSGEMGAVLGQHIVRVTPVERDDPEPGSVVIPHKYNNRSELQREVKSGQNTINLELTSK
jgi:hypothetical protein